MCLLLLCLPPFLHLCLPMCLHRLLTMAPSPDHGSRSKLTPVEITTKGHDLPTYVVEASGIFFTTKEDCKENFSPVFEVGSPSHSTPKTPVVHVNSAKVSKPEHHCTCPVVLESLD